MSNGRRRRRRYADKPKYSPSAFGGWGDYRTWAEHQFLPRPAQAEAEEAADDGTRDDESRVAGSRVAGTWDDGLRDDGSRDAGAGVVDVGGEGAHGDPETPGAGAGDRHAGLLPDAVPPAGPGPVTGPDRAAPHPAPYPRDSRQDSQQDWRPVGPRPYVLAGGRTGGEGLPRMDALISVTPEGTLSVGDPALSPEYRRICDMCQEPMAVVEIAGRLRVPIGVAAVLVGDAIGWNLLREHTPAEVDGRPSIGVITRVHEGLLRLR